MVRTHARSKPEWWKKYKDPVIRDKWTAEALGAATTRVAPLQPEHVQYVLDELQEYDLARDEAARIQVRGLKAWPPKALGFN